MRGSRSGLYSHLGGHGLGGGASQRPSLRTGLDASALAAAASALNPLTWASGGAVGSPGGGPTSAGGPRLNGRGRPSNSELQDDGLALLP
jgi:hypothetical protein